MSSEGVSRKRRRRWIAGGLAVGLAAAVFGFASAFANPGSSPGSEPASTTPIKHLVVIFQENESFDHYFGTYPYAANDNPAEPSFTPEPGTPSVNGLGKALLTANPNEANPRRLTRAESLTCDMDHGYADEQKAFDKGLMDEFVKWTSNHYGECEPSMVMNYYDGNTVTGLWNLAQHFSLSDNSYDTQFGPSTVGALNLISGETHGASPAQVSGAVENGTVIGDPDPAFDDCGKGGVEMSGTNIGDALTKREITWGWFQGGFAPTSYNGEKAVCGAEHRNIGNAKVIDYSPHHNPFEYYKSTSNPHHRAPESEAMIGYNEAGAPEKGANHQYDIAEFDEAIKHGNLPTVSFLKAPEYQDGHPGYSDPLDEQAFIAEKLDELERSNQWENTAVVIAYDDSDGWYDHQMPPIVNQSESVSDNLTGPGLCRGFTAAEEEEDEAEDGQKQHQPLTGILDRCGYGPRLPLMVISPYSKQNYVDNTLTDQSSITRFIEENWQLGPISSTSMDNKAGSLDGMFEFSGSARAPKVFLDPTDGTIIGEEGGSEEGSEEGGHGGGGDDGGHGHDHGDEDDHGGWSEGGSGGHGHHDKVRCAVDGHRRQVELNCSVSGDKGHGAVRFRIVRGHKVFGTSRASIQGTKASATVKSRQSLAGKYTLLATVSRTDGIDALSQSVSLPGKGSVDLH